MKLPSLESVHVLVVGDVMLDRYWIGSARRVSQEAPVPVVDVEHTDDRPGGAANVALNVASLGARCTLVGLVGADEAARTLTETLAAAGVDCDLVTVPGWSTILKLRVLSRKQQLLRTDFEQPLPAPPFEQLAERVRAHLGAATALVLQDYDKGALLEPERLIELAAAAQVPVVVDPKYKPLARYAGATLVKPNRHEFEAAVGPWPDEDTLVARAQDACLTHRLGALVVTRGGRGMTVVAQDGHHQHVPARATPRPRRSGSPSASAGIRSPVRNSRTSRRRSPSANRAPRR